MAYNAVRQASKQEVGAFPFLRLHLDLTIYRRKVRRTAKSRVKRRRGRLVIVASRHMRHRFQTCGLQKSRFIKVTSAVLDATFYIVSTFW